MLPVVALAERLELPLAYADNVDLHENPQTREYPTTGQAAAASGPQTRR
jgi:hypothetical protein